MHVEKIKNVVKTAAKSQNTEEFFCAPKKLKFKSGESWKIR